MGTEPFSENFRERPHFQILGRGSLAKGIEVRCPQDEICCLGLILRSKGCRIHPLVDRESGTLGMESLNKFRKLKERL